MTLVKVERLCLHRGRVETLHELSFELEAGQRVGLLGLNGAGKTTLMRALVGELPVSSGTASIAGIDLLAHPHLARAKIGYLPEPMRLEHEHSPREALTFSSRLGASQAQRPIDELLAMCGLERHADERIGRLSHGYKKRVGLALALLHKPALLLLDEPFSGLDPAQIKTTRALLGALPQDVALLLSSHQLSELEQVCDKVLVLHHGRLLEHDAGQWAAKPKAVTVIVDGDLEVATAALKEQGLNITAHERAQDLSWRLRLTLTMSQREATVRSLVMAGLGVRALIPEQRELEALFLGLTQDHPQPPTTTQDQPR